MALSDFEYLRLDVFGRGVGGQLGKLGVEVAERFGFHFSRRAALQRRNDEIARIIDGEADQLVELGSVSGGFRARSAGRTARRCPCPRRQAG